jgi:hypothetical protein
MYKLLVRIVALLLMISLSMDHTFAGAMAQDISQTSYSRQSRLTPSYFPDKQALDLPSTWFIKLSWFVDARKMGSSKSNGGIRSKYKKKRIKRLMAIAEEEIPVFLMRMLGDRAEITSQERTALTKTLLNEIIVIGKPKIEKIPGLKKAMIHDIPATIFLLVLGIFLLKDPERGLWGVFYKVVGYSSLTVVVIITLLTPFLALVTHGLAWLFNFRIESTAAAASRKEVLFFSETLNETKIELIGILWHEWTHRLKLLRLIKSDVVTSSAERVRTDELRAHKMQSGYLNLEDSYLTTTPIREGQYIAQFISDHPNLELYERQKLLNDLMKNRWADFEIREKVVALISAIPRLLMRYPVWPENYMRADRLAGFCSWFRGKSYAPYDPNETAYFLIRQLAAGKSLSETYDIHIRRAA